MGEISKWSGCLDLPKMPDARVPCIHYVYCQFQAGCTNLHDLYTQQHRHHTIEIPTRHETTAYDWFKHNTKIYWVLTPYTRQDTLYQVIIQTVYSQSNPTQFSHTETLQQHVSLFFKLMYTIMLLTAHMIWQHS